MPGHGSPAGHRRRVIKIVEVMELVIFDCDRVLIDSDRILLRVQAEMLCEFRPHSKPPETVGRRRDFESADISGPWKQPSIVRRTEPSTRDATSSDSATRSPNAAAYAGPAPANTGGHQPRDSHTARQVR